MVFQSGPEVPRWHSRTLTIRRRDGMGRALKGFTEPSSCSLDATSNRPATRNGSSGMLNAGHF